MTNPTATVPADLQILFEPIEVGEVTLSNRIVMTGHGTGMAEHHLPSAQHAAYYRERARGGVGMIGMAFPQIHPSSQNVPGEVQAYDPAVVPGLRKIADAVHEYETKIVMQLGHTGRQSSSTWSERPLFAPSSIPCALNREMPKAMEIEDIDELVEAHAVSAVHAREGGFDGVEIHSGYGGYLLASFLSPFSNFREDEYGGSVANRVRFARRALEAVRDAVGRDYLVGMNMQGHDFSPGGLEVSDAKEIAALLTGTGLLDYVVVKGATYYSASQNVPDMQHPKGVWLDLAASLREVVDVPVIAVGRVTDPYAAAQVLRDGGADLIAMTRQHIADPETVTKIRENRLEDLRGCIACNQGCIDRLFKITHTTCVHNPAAGYELELGEGTLVQAPADGGRVVVVGGGPAGMKAAEVCARRGFDTVLLERRERLGGQLRLASSVAGREEIAEVIRHLEVQLEKLGVEVRTGADADHEAVRALAPDHVLVATGSAPGRRIVGNLSHGVEATGLDSERVLDTFEVLERGAAVGEEVLIVDDGEGGWKGIALALQLAEEGKRVHLSTPLPYVGAALGPFTQNKLVPRVAAAGIVRHPFSLLIAVEDEDVVLRTDGEPHRLAGIDTVILAGWHEPVTDLYFDLKPRHGSVRRIGDAVASRTMLESIHEAERVARSV
ncbi:MAG: FAD-dependent oxidoreductase [Actinobacteria bacterium]|nr:FAD-dependent oxidoreductase [Actinomycetota bacterium]